MDVERIESMAVGATVEVGEVTVSHPSPSRWRWVTPTGNQVEVTAADDEWFVEVNSVEVETPGPIVDFATAWAVGNE
jgi:hypothetical protein